MGAIYISEDIVKKFLDMPKTLELTEEMFTLFAQGKAFNTVRTRARIRKGALHILPAALPTKKVMGYKAYTSFKEGAVFRFYLYNAENGALLAVIDAEEIGRLRTGAASGIAAKYLARANSVRCVIFGAGYQAESQLEAIHAVRPLSRADVVNLDPEKGIAFAENMSKKLKTEVTHTTNPKESVLSADIIATATWSVKPVIDKSWSFKPGVHINAAGANALIRAEIPESVVESAFVVVDDKEVAKTECGDILPSLEKGRLHWNSVAELGDIVAGFRRGRTDNEMITLFESQGMGLQDLICAEYVYAKTLEAGLGAEMPF
ncbi:MAG: ornithine cyclodeaminase family protein [Deferribacteraceae bacterium]|jgi:ornithine cyclodeaminase|nr:ornithine cyclodeaminase family protein [Deferribacteraceae bacterium]